MATLNIKNFPDDLHEKLKARASANRRPMAREVVHLLTQATDDEPLSILELRGLGKDVWRDIEPTDHTAAERDAWE